MIKMLTLLLVLGGLALALAALPARAAGVFPYEVRRETLDNGLRVLMVPVPSGGLVAYWSIVRTGSRDEVEPGVTGFAHFFEHMMFRGSEKYPSAVYDGLVASMGADANAFTTDDFTAYHLSVTRDDLPTVIEIESDRFRNLAYDETAFKTEAGAVYGEYRKGRTSPFQVLYEAVQNAAFDRHTYKHTTIGFEGDIRNMPAQYEYSKSFFKRFYRPDNVVLLVVGDFDPKATLGLIQKAYGGWAAGYQAPQVPTEPEQTTQRRLLVPFEGQTLPMLSISFKSDPLLAADATMVAGTLLGELAFGETSELYRRLVLDEQRVQSLTPGFELNRDPGLWDVTAVVKDPADVAAVEGEIWGAVRALAEHPVDQARLDAVRSHLKYGFLSGLTSPPRVASQVARFIALTGDLGAIDALWATYPRITPADVQRAARRYLTPERSTVAVLHTAGQAPPEPRALEEPVLLQEPSDPNVAFKLWLRVGSQDDPAGKEGLAALTAALIGEGGTQKTTYEKMLERLFPLAAAYSVSVDKEMTVVSGLAHRDTLDAFYPLMLEALLEPGFREDDFERLRSEAVDLLEKRLRYSSDEELGKAALYGQVFRGTPYAHLDDGTVAGLKAITLDDVRRFYAAHYTRGNVVVGLGGAVGPELARRLTADLQRLPDGTPAAAPELELAAAKGRDVVLVEKPGQSTAISLGVPIDVTRGSKEFYALWVANSWLGEHRHSISHLFQVIREARGMNYGDYSYIEAFPQGGFRNMPPTGVARRRQLFEVWIRPVPDDRAVFALRAALREVERLVANGLTREQFEKQRDFLTKYSVQFAKTTAERLGYAIDDRFYGIEEGHLARFRRMMRELTLEEVNAALHKYIRADALTIAMVTANAQEMKRRLLSGERSPIDYGEIEKPASILDEDRKIETYPLHIEASRVQIVPVDRMFE